MNTKRKGRGEKPPQLQGKLLCVHCDSILAYIKTKLDILDSLWTKTFKRNIRSVV